MADDYHVPKGVSLETLFEILSGWSAVGAAAEPQDTADVERNEGGSNSASATKAKSTWRRSGT